jgi:hypothetical protein
MIFDSYLTLDFIFFFYTDEADFDDFIVMVYMVLFFFLMLSDYDMSSTVHGEEKRLYDYFGSFYNPKIHSGDLALSFAYYNLIQIR